MQRTIFIENLLRSQIALAQAVLAQQAALDGISLPGAENGPIPRFDTLPSTVSSRVDANKTILPSMLGESVSGYIDIASFDAGKPWEANPTHSIGVTHYDSLGVKKAWLASGVLAPELQPPPNLQVQIDEDIIAAYAMATTRFDWGNVASGQRINDSGKRA